MGTTASTATRHRLELIKSTQVIISFGKVTFQHVDKTMEVQPSIVLTGWAPAQIILEHTCEMIMPISEFPTKETLPKYHLSASREDDDDGRDGVR